MQRLLSTLILILNFSLSCNDKIPDKKTRYPYPKAKHPQQGAPAKHIPDPSPCDRCLKTTGSIICCGPTCCVITYLFCCKKTF